jgi:hypothetical protein
VLSQSALHDLEYFFFNYAFDEFVEANFVNRFVNNSDHLGPLALLNCLFVETGSHPYDRRSGDQFLLLGAKIGVELFLVLSNFVSTINSIHNGHV